MQKEIKEFLDMLGAEKGCSKNTILAYGSDLVHFETFLKKELGKTNLLLVKKDEDFDDWQLSLAAPQNSSGWFLPSYGQIAYAAAGYHLGRDDVWKFMDGQFEKVKNATTNEGLKDEDKIRAVERYIDDDIDRWMETPWRNYKIVTSSEEMNGSESSLREYLYTGERGANYNMVRPVLAF